LGLSIPLLKLWLETTKVSLNRPIKSWSGPFVNIFNPNLGQEKDVPIGQWMTVHRQLKAHQSKKTG
jgi:hypothetical protein